MLAALSAVLVLAAASETPTKSPTERIVDDFLDGLPAEAPAPDPPLAPTAAPPAASPTPEGPDGFCPALQRVIAETILPSGPRDATALIPGYNASIDPKDGYWTLVELPERSLLVQRASRVAQGVAACLPGWTGATGRDPRDAEVFLLANGRQSVEVIPRLTEVSSSIQIVVNRQVPVQYAHTKTWTPPAPPAPPKDLYAALDHVIEVGSDALAGVEISNNSVTIQVPVERDAHDAYTEYGEYELPASRPVTLLSRRFTSILIPPGAQAASAEHVNDDHFFRAVFARWPLAGGKPSPAQTDAIVSTLRGLTAQVGRCLPAPEWSPESFAPTRGSAGVVLFKRAKAEVRVTGLVSEQEVSAEIVVRSR